MRVELHTRGPSALGDEVRAVLERVRARVPFELIDQVGDDDVPVVYLDGRRLFRGAVSEAKLVRALERRRAFAMGVPGALERGQPDRASKLVFAGAATLALAGAVAYVALQKLVAEPALEIRSLDITPESFPAPPFTLVDAQGTPHTLQDYRGKLVLLNFWASWCAPCRAEIPDMARLAMELGSHADFAMLAVSVDDGWPPIQGFFQQEFGSIPPPFTVLRDAGAKVSELYGTNQYPETYVIDRSGKVIAKLVGGRDWGTPAAKRYLEQLLNS